MANVKSRLSYVLPLAVPFPRMESASEMENKYPVDVLSQFRFEIKKYFYNCHIFDSVSQNLIKNVVAAGRGRYTLSTVTISWIEFMWEIV